MKPASPFYLVLCVTVLVASASAVHAQQKTDLKLDQKATLYLAQLRKASKPYDNNAIYQLAIQPEFTKILMQSARQNNDALVRELLAISYAGGDAESGTALTLAAYANNAKLVQVLLSHPQVLQTINATGSSKWTALHQAAGEYRGTIAQMLLDKGADIEARTADGETPLMLAAANKFTDTALLLLDRGANVNVVDAAGRTALMNAAASGRLNEVTLLLDRGANADTKDNKGHMAFDLAALANYASLSDSPGYLPQGMADQLRLQAEADLKEIKRLLMEKMEKTGSNRPAG